MTKAQSVEACLAAAPKEMQGKLRELRRIIKTTAPSAKERISYGMPYYEYKGRLAYFALQKAHIGLYIPPPIIGRHKKELATFGTTLSAVHLPVEGKLPAPLIRKLIKARMKWNEAKIKTKKA